jgi:uncharacterized alkaline shock family protein YloU
VTSSSMETGPRTETLTAENQRNRTSQGQAQGQTHGNQGHSAQSGQQSQQASQPNPSSQQNRGAAGLVSLNGDTGNTRIADGVVAKIAGLAARDIPGVFSMGSGMARRVGQLKSLIPGSSEAAGQGVSVEVGEREAAIDLNIVTWYGQSIVEISEAVRRNVVGQVEGMTGLRVVEVNIQVDDIQVESTQDTVEQRVQ